MKQSSKFEILSLGLAIFSMFFGAGNVIFPLVVGKSAGAMSAYAISGLILTAAAMPVLGLYGMVLFHGNIPEFFGRLGKVPGFLISCLTIFLLGPFGSTPRCITLSYTTLFQNSSIEISSSMFSGLACIGIYFICIKRSQILNILGRFLTPILMLSLGAIILLGFLADANPSTNTQGPLELFFYGMTEGYKTMDLLAAFFFSATIIHLLRRMMDAKKVESMALKGSAIGVVLLALVYIGFSSISALHGDSIFVDGEEQLLAAITTKIAGPVGGILVRATVSLACLTTAVVLITSFTEFFRAQVLRNKLSYRKSLAVALGMTFVISTLDYSGISAFLVPILNVCYPALIVLTLLNIAYKVWNVKLVKAPVYITLALTVFYQYVF